MTTDFQQARYALGLRLRELRTEGGLTGRQLGDRLGWTQSKVSKLETGRQTATHEDLRAWADGVGQPEAAAELSARLRAFETQSRSWRRQLAAGHRPVQDRLTIECESSSVLRAWESAIIAGLLQTPDYARHIFEAYVRLHRSPRDIDEAVQARIRRQELLYRRGKRFHIVMWEAALRARICPPGVMAAQLDRLSGVIGLDNVTLGIVPFDAPGRTAARQRVLDPRRTPGHRRGLARRTLAGRPRQRVALPARVGVAEPRGRPRRGRPAGDRPVPSGTEQQLSRNLRQAANSPHPQGNSRESGPFRRTAAT